MTAQPDRLYNLLPVVYRERDAEQGFPLRALLRVIAAQVDVVEEDIDRLYENWFIETCEEWALPYIGELVGYQPVHPAGGGGGEQAAAAEAINRILVPRTDVAKTIGYRRRKGTRSLLELLANDVAGWPARVVEFGRLVSVMQATNHPRLEAGLVANIGTGDVVDLVDGPFDLLAHTADIRRITATRHSGRYGLNSVGLFVWRLRAYSMTQSPAYLLEERSGDNCYTFSILGIDTRLYGHPVPETDPAQIAQEPNLPVPIRRRAFEQRTRVGGEVQRRASEAYYGADKSVALWKLRDPKTRELELIPQKQVIPADLSGWAYEPASGYVAVDPNLGRVVFAAGEGPADGLWVSYYYGFPADMGGGEYERTLRTGFRPAETTQETATPATSYGQTTPPVQEVRIPQYVRVGKTDKADYQTITEALRAVQGEAPAGGATAGSEPRRKSRRAPAAPPPPPAPPPPRDAIIEIIDSEVYEEEELEVTVKADQRLEIRAASGVRPVIRRVDWHASRQDDLLITIDRGSRFFLDGILVSGRGLEIRRARIEAPPTEVYGQQPGGYKPQPSEPEPEPTGCALSQVTIRHCTLVPGWAVRHDCTPLHPAEPSVTLNHAQARLVIERSIVGSIQVQEDSSAPVDIWITDSIVDATGPEREAVGAPGERPASATLRVQCATVIGRIWAHAIELAENSIFNGDVRVERRQIGCIRFCYVPPGSQTPRQYECQPQTAAAGATDGDRTQIEHRVRPRFSSRRYGTPDYCQLALSCPDEILRGAEDESEMGVYHHLFQPQRTTNLRIRLTEYVPAGVDVALIFAS
jgi:hypothetical protein